MNQEVVLIGGTNNGRRIEIGPNALANKTVRVCNKLDSTVLETYIAKTIRSIIGDSTIWCHKDMRINQLLPTLLKGYSHEKEIN